MTEQDALIGLRFELSGGLGKMSGKILGKAGALYLIRREGADHLELVELDDLRSARFFDGSRSQAKTTSTVTKLDPASPRPAPAAAPRFFDKIKKSTAVADTTDD